MMTKEDIWSLFKITGNINYYLTYQYMIEKEIDILGDKES